MSVETLYQEDAALWRKLQDLPKDRREKIMCQTFAWFFGRAEGSREKLPRAFFNHVCEEMERIDE